MDGSILEGVINRGKEGGGGGGGLFPDLRFTPPFSWRPGLFFLPRRFPSGAVEEGGSLMRP